MRTLLVIDDNQSVRESLRFLFLRRGYDVLVAENGAEGIALAKQHWVDAAMVDVNMPGMNGVDVCKALREQATAAGRPISVWMMTGARTPDLAKRALEAGALALLGKPFDFADLFRQFDEKLGAPVVPQAGPETPP
ncbi:MAG TPA: response regulator [Opitutaceae bacterium]|nr:response regulator [Opitutaceae bacterium]